MCGLVFSYREDLDDDEHEFKSRKALQRIKYRGPDAQAIYQKRNVVIGHCRLSIIDLNSSSQPMSDPTGRFTLSFNGEIYNYKSIKQGLRRHWQFKTEGDTEVLLAGLIIHGVSFLDKLEGMWAFVLWDERNKSLIAARDRLGKKPLFYSSSFQKFSCASELPALSCLDDKAWEEDSNSSADYLRYGCYLPGTTAYKKVNELLPGHVLAWSYGESCVQKPYWSLSFSKFSGTEAQAKEQFREHLFYAVKKRLIADVEVGAFLSGGIDSSLVVSIMSELGVNNLKTFTIGFNDNTFDERKFARIVADQYGTEHHEELLESWDAQTLENLIINNIGQPFSDASLLPTASVSALAAKHVKVALSGDGADELFCGYQRYQARAMLRWYTRLPTCLRNTANRMIRAIPEPSSHHSSSVIKKAHLFQDIVDRYQNSSPYVAPTLYSILEFKKLAPEFCDLGHMAPAYEAESRLDDLHNMMARDVLVYLPQDILAKVDRASMSSSLEVRAPFLDKDVVEFAFSLPSDWHRSNVRGKRMIRGSFRDLLPNLIWNRRKQGFSTPVHLWFRGSLGKDLEQLIRESKDSINGEYVQNILNMHRKRVRDYGHKLWNIYLYLLWKNNGLFQSTGN